MKKQFIALAMSLIVISTNIIHTQNLIETKNSAKRHIVAQQFANKQDKEILNLYASPKAKQLYKNLRLSGKSIDDSQKLANEEEAHYLSVPGR